MGGLPRRARETGKSRTLEILLGGIEQGTDVDQYFSSPLKMKDECIKLGKAALATPINECAHFNAQV